MSNWPDCVVSYFDLIGIRKKISAANSEASTLMRNFHVLVYKSINSDMPTHHHAYVWNDSAMFLAFPQKTGDYETIMQELNAVKPQLDNICHSYTICVKGQAMPEPVCGYGTEVKGQSRFVFLRTSSYAFTNCFEVEEQLKSLEMDWYVDSRIARKIPNFPRCDQYAVKILPSGRKRNFHVLKGLIWEHP
jgi:hypothetical protein